MSKFNAVAAKGWEAGPDTPDIIAEYITRQARQGNDGAPLFGYRIVRAGADPESNLTNLTSSRLAPELFDEVQWIANALANPGVQRVEVYFMHPGAKVAPVPLGAREGPKPPPPASAPCGHDLWAAVRFFVNAVADSLHAPGEEFASCRWAALTFTK